jgi:hypothetical protein
MSQRLSVNVILAGRSDTGDATVIGITEVYEFHYKIC